MVLLLSTWFACTSAPSPTPASAPPPEPSTTEPLDVVALSHPVAWLTTQIGGAHVSVAVAPPDGADPVTWQPAPEAIATIQDADLIVMNGAGFEAWTATATLPPAKLVDTTKGLDLIHTETVTHSHGDDGEHSHGGIDPHTWSDPLLFLAQAKAIHARLLREAPAHTDAFDAGYGGLQTTLTTLHEEIAAALAPASRFSLAANHPAYAYVAKRHGQVVTSFDVDPEAAPDHDTVHDVDHWMKDTPGPHVMWWEAAPTNAVTTALPSAITHIRVDPLEQPAGATYDYVAQVRANVATLTKAFAPTEPNTP